MSLIVTDLDRLRMRFQYLLQLRRVPEAAWPLVVQIYELSGFDHACATIRGWREDQ